MTEHFTLDPRFAVTARTGLGAAAALTFEPGTATGPRLLVPVDVQALVVPPGTTVEHADVRSRLFDQLPLAGQPVLPEPFAPDLPARELGVRLHWALPDGLTQGRTTGPDGSPRWRPLPDRWLVLRLLPADAGAERRAVTGWVVEAERRRVTPLASWRPGPPVAADPPPATPLLDPADLQPMLGGDPAWAAIFDNVENRFGFHDAWDGLAAPPEGAVAYVVTGWYSRPGLDPLSDAGTAEGFAARLAELGWSVDAARLTALRQAAETAAAAARGIGLPAAADELTVSADFGALAPAATPDPRPWWPRRTMFHGVVYGVRVTDPPPDRRPEPAAVRVALGETGEQAMAALFAATLGDPDAELLQAAFGTGLMAKLGEPDGLAQVEAELHGTAFDAKAGGTRTERVLAGDPFGDVRGASAAPATTELLASFPDRSVRFAFSGDGRRIADLHTAIATPARAAAPPEPRTIEEVELPAPRWHAPRDPSFVVRGLNRSLRHGYDGRFDPADTLPCRLTGDPVSRLLGFLDGHELLEHGVDHGGVPAEADALLVEAAIEDPFAGYGGLLERFGSRFGYSFAALQAALRGESRLFRWWLATTHAATPLLEYSLKDGVGAAPAGITIWRQAWVPLYLEWELRADPDRDPDGWPLGELDREPPAGLALPSWPAAPVTLRGRSLLNPASARALSDQIRSFLATEDQLDLSDRGRVPEDVEATLTALSDEAGHADLLTAGLNRFRDRLLGFDYATARGGGDRLPGSAPRPVRAGLARIERLRVIDAFGRTLTLVDQAAPAPALSRGLRPTAPADPGTLLLRPRINQPTRLLLRLADPTDDRREAGVDQGPASAGGGSVSPVAGWLLPDHADGALELFGPDGGPLGQLFHDPLTGAVMWEGPPGDRSPVGATPEESMAGDLRLRHLAALARGLLARDAAERVAIPAGLERSDTPLEALLRVIETTSATVGLGGRTGTEHVAQLVGRPVAVVRATLRFDVEAEPVFASLPTAEREARAAAWAALAGRAVPVRLGALTRLEDGLLGFFADDDYGRLRPVHEAVLDQALASGPHQGDLAPPGSPAADPRPITTGYVAADPLLALRPARSVPVTLLQDPGATVHATSGLLPRKEISLLREWIEAPLARLVPSFRVGPVLVDPAAIRMPLASALGSRQEWSRRDGPTGWRQDPIAAATQQALLPDTTAVAQEGYLRVSLEDDPEGPS